MLTEKGYNCETPMAWREEHPMRGYIQERYPRLMRNISLILVYGVILVVLVLIGFHLEGEEAAEEVPTFGSLEGRFTSDITLEYDGTIRYYRENEITNYLLIGIDREISVSADYQNGGQADFLLMLSIDRRNRTITPVMIDRDTMTAVDTYGVFGHPAGQRVMQICLAQAYRGIHLNGSQNTSNAVSILLEGVKVDHYLLMNLGGIVVLNDAMGGIEVTLDDDFTAMDAAMQKGATIRLTGAQAEYFVRGRTTVSDGTNQSRMRRQRVYIEALVEELERRLASNEGFAEEVLETLSTYVESDASTNVLLNDFNMYSDYEWNALRMLSGEHCIGQDGFAEFWIDEVQAREMIVDIWFAQ